MRLQLAPSYKAIAFAILKNDHSFSTLGFSPPQSEWYGHLKRIELAERESMAILQNQTTEVFVDKDMLALKVCKKTHGDNGKPCKKPHGIPVDCFWSGTVPADEIGDFIGDLRESRKKFRKALKRWERQLQALKHKKAAPHFQGYLRSITARHITEKPVFSFSWKPH